MPALLRDILFALRSLLKSPAYTLVAIFTLALGIGANTAIFSAVNNMLVRPLPYDRPDELMVMLETQPERERMAVPYLNYLDYRAGQTSFSEFEAMGLYSMNLTGGGDPEKLAVQMNSRGLLPMLGYTPALGRDFLPEEDAPGGARAALLGHGFWTRRFAADPAILGQTITLDGNVYTVVGVTPEDYRPFYPTDVYIALGARADEPTFRDRTVRPEIYPLGRRKPGVSETQARADLLAIGETIAQRHPDQVGLSRPIVMPLADVLVEENATTLLLLLGAVMFVLLIAAANVANLTLERAMARQRELGIRAALGAGRWQLIRQLLVESMLLAIAGAALGLLLALWGVDLLSAMRPQDIMAMFHGPIEIDRTVLAYTLAVALATGLLFGLIPAVHASRQDVAQVLKDGDLHATTGSRQLGPRDILVVSEVALALMLTIGTTLAIRSLLHMQSVDPGFAPENLLRAAVSLPPSRFTTPDQIQDYWTEVQRQVAAIPGVTSVSVTSGQPGGDAPFDQFWPLGVARTPENTRAAVTYGVDLGYIETLKIPLLAGRTFGPADGPGTPPVVLVDQALAELLFPGQDPIGQRLQERASGQPSAEIVGVVGHVKQEGLGAPERTPYQLYYSYRQLPAGPQVEALGITMFLVARTDADPEAMLPQIRATLTSIDPTLPMWGVGTIDEMMRGSLGSRRFSVGLLAVFAGLAVLLAAVGLYAVMANNVARRTHELGVRMALGAQPRAVLTLVLTQGLRRVAVGVALGILGAFAVTRLMTTLLTDQVSPADPLTYVGVAAFLVVVGALATYIPARRATRIDPMVALRHT